MRDLDDAAGPELVAAHTAGYAEGYVEGAMVRSRWSRIALRALAMGAAYAAGAVLAELLAGGVAR